MKDGDSKERIMNKEQVKDKGTALHDIKCLEDAIIMEQEIIERAICKTEQKIREYRERIEELKIIAKS